MIQFLSLDVLAILPELLILILAGFVLLFDAIWPEERRRNLGWLTFGGLVLTMVISILVGVPQGSRASLLGGMISYDWMAFAMKMVFIFGAAITALLAMDSPKLGTRGEFYILMLVSTIGMNFMASADDLIMLYLAIETTSIPLYILAGFFRRDQKSVEAGFKYLMFGAMTSAVMLYGFSLLYGLTGTTNLAMLYYAISSNSAPLLAVAFSLILILVGFGFKISVVPFHFWAPDVYDGAPTPIAGFLSTASKAAGFTVLLRILLYVFTTVELVPVWSTILAAISVLTMTVGNILAISQKNIKRLLAYSSIAHAGYILIGVVAVSSLGIVSVIFYLVAYLLTNLAAFGIVVAFSHTVKSDEIKDYAGLSRRAPTLALMMLVAFLSLSGMPPFGGFVAKVFVFAAAVQSNYIWLAVVGVLNSIIGLYYYLNVLKYVYLYRAPEEIEKAPLPLTRPYVIALSILTLGIIAIGTFFSPWFNWATTAAYSMFY